MEYLEDIEIVGLELFDAAFLVEPGNDDAVKRRFMTLFAQGSRTLRGGSAEVLRVTNAAGEVFAVKRLRRTGLSGGANASSEVAGSSAEETRGSSPTSGSGGSERRKLLRSSMSRSARGVSQSATPDYVTAGHVAAFYEEYRMHLAVAHLRGFPKLYGFGIADGEPLIVMEWVEGETLRQAVQELTGGDAPEGGRPEPEGGGVPEDSLLPLLAVADVGLAVLRLLANASELDGRFVHRDISPRNIILRSDRTPPDRQLLTGELDLCLIDFGSASYAAPLDPTFTMDAGVWRMGTPAYAPPEMLTADVEIAPEARRSAAIDVYALSSVLYELYCGRPPFEISSREASPYLAKAGRFPGQPAVREPDGGALADIIMTGLSPEQKDRPSVPQMRAALENWKELPGERSAGALPRAAAVAAGPSDAADASGIRRGGEDEGGDGRGVSGKAGRAADRSGGSTFWNPGQARRIVSRRRFVAAGIVGAAAVVSGVLVAGRLTSGGARAVDPSRYPLAAGIYAGEPLFKALDAGSPAWMLCTEAGEIRCRPSTSRECGALREGLVAVYDDASGFWGYMTPVDADEDAAGCAWVVPPAFAQAGDFSEGLAAARDAQTGLWGYVDAEGDWRVAPRFGDAGVFGGGAAAVRDDGAGGLWGAIDAGGAWLIEPRFTALGTRSENGLAVAEESPGRWGIVDGDGSWTSASRFDRLRRAASGLALRAEAGGRATATGSAPASGATSASGPASESGDAGASGSAGSVTADGSSALVPARASAGDLWGFVDGEGRWAIEPAYLDARPFSSGKAAVQDAETQLWLFIGPDGVPSGGMAPRFWKLGELFDGLAPAQASVSDSRVVFDDAEPDVYADFAGMRYGYVDAAGEWHMRRLTDLVDTAIATPSI